MAPAQASALALPPLRVDTNLSCHATLHCIEPCSPSEHVVQPAYHGPLTPPSSRHAHTLLPMEPQTAARGPSTGSSAGENDRYREVFGDLMNTEKMTSREPESSGASARNSTSPEKAETPSITEIANGPLLERSPQDGDAAETLMSISHSTAGFSKSQRTLPGLGPHVSLESKWSPTTLAGVRSDYHLPGYIRYPGSQSMLSDSRSYFKTGYQAGHGPHMPAPGPAFTFTSSSAAPLYRAQLSSSQTLPALLTSSRDQGSLAGSSHYHQTGYEAGHSRRLGSPFTSESGRDKTAPSNFARGLAHAGTYLKTAAPYPAGYPPSATFDAQPRFSRDQGWPAGYSYSSQPPRPADYGLISATSPAHRGGTGGEVGSNSPPRTAQSAVNHESSANRKRARSSDRTIEAENSDVEEQETKKQRGTCSACRDCTEDAFRGAVSHLFGRNKQVTKLIPAHLMPSQCRKSYQRAKYNADKAGTYYDVQAEMCLEVVQGLRKWWQATLRQREELTWTVKMTTEVASNPAKMPIEAELQRQLVAAGLFGDSLSTDQVVRALRKLTDETIPGIKAGRFEFPAGIDDKVRKAAEDWIKKPNLGRIELLPFGLEDAKKRGVNLNQ